MKLDQILRRAAIDPERRGEVIFPLRLGLFCELTEEKVLKAANLYNLEASAVSVGWLEKRVTFKVSGRLGDFEQFWKFFIMAHADKIEYGEDWAR